MYGDNKPTEDAIDRVVGKINQEYVTLFFSHDSCSYTCFSIDKKGKFSRKRLNEDEGDITYINEHNRVFNKKVSSLNSQEQNADPDVHISTDRTILRQVHRRDSGEFRAWYCPLIHTILRGAITGGDACWSTLVTYVYVPDI